MSCSRSEHGSLRTRCLSDCVAAGLALVRANALGRAGAERPRRARWPMRPRRWIARRSARCSKQRADVNAPQADGMTALHWAVYHDDLEMAELLLARRRQRARRPTATA